MAYDQQQHGGALEPTYGQEEAGGYEVEEPRRVSWTMRIAGAVVVAIGLGYGLAQAYKAVLGGPAPDGATPVVSSEATPAKEKPLDPGGKQFSHTDSKVLGRLGDGGSATEEQPGGLSESDASNGSQESDDARGRPRWFDCAARGRYCRAGRLRTSKRPAFPFPGSPSSTLSAVPPKPRRGTRLPNSRPRLRRWSSTRRRRRASTSSPPRSFRRRRPAFRTTSRRPTVAPKKQKVAVAAPAAGEEPPPALRGANGYVVVLASVPASGISRLDALRKFADMQQQYGPVLANKTPDVRETTLAGKGAYHRLLVGPPGSRSQASELCTQLKASGYKDCWVTAY